MKYRKWFIVLSALMVLGLLLSSCAQATPEPAVIEPEPEEVEEVLSNQPDPLGGPHTPLKNPSQNQRKNAQAG